MDDYRFSGRDSIGDTWLVCRRHSSLTFLLGEDCPRCHPLGYKIIQGIAYLLSLCLGGAFLYGLYLLATLGKTL